MKSIIVGEWLVVLRGPARGRSGPVTVKIKGVAAEDKLMARALAMVAAVWLNASRRRA